MIIRVRAVLVIVLTTLIIIIFSIFSGIIFVKSNIERSQEMDLLVISDIADHFISSEIKLLKLKTVGAAYRLSEHEETKWQEIMTNFQAENSEFIGMAVLDAEQGVVASSGELPASFEIKDDEYIQRAFQGGEVITSTVPLPDDESIVFYLAAPIAGTRNRILVLTLSGMYFSDMVGTFVIWETGHIFVDDEYGHVIANIRPEWVNTRINFIHRAQTDSSYEDIANVLNRAIDGETGTGRFSISNVPRLCAFRPISGSDEGWFLGVIAPLPESPFRDIDRGLIVVGLVSFLLSLIAAIIASGFLKRPFDELARAEKLTKLMLDMSPLCCQIWDKNINIIDCNEAAVKLYGFKNKQEHIDRFFECSPEYQPDGQRSDETIAMFVKKAFSEGRFVKKWMHQLPDGTPLPSEVTLIRVKYKNDYIIIAYTHDMREHYKMIEEMRRAEIAEESNKIKSKFLATMSHEIRTPMNSIMGFVELALDMTDNNFVLHIKDYLGKIKDSTKWLLNIVNDILDISKIEAGKIELEKVPFDLREIMSRCQSAILHSVKEKGVDFSIYAEPLNGKKLMGDPIRLYQALMNLLSNAVKFTDNGTVKFSSLVKNSERNTAAVYFEVKDSGIGMSEEQLEKIFEPFIQADSSTTRTYGGSGLGLTITKNIVELMGGTLEVESTLGGGSQFSFEIVFDTVDSFDSSEETTELENIDLLERPYFDALILVCDDNLMNQEVICRHLAQVGIETVVAENGSTGVEAVRERVLKGEKPFDLIFMDIFMPIMDGIEAASNIVALNTGTPIVALTANIMNSDLENYRKNGIPDCLGKPFTSQELWRVLLKYLVPVRNPNANADNPDGDKDDLQIKLQISFVKNNQEKYAEILEAIEAGDVKTAHRVTHTLKGNAGLIYETQLKDAATEVENLLKEGIISIPDDKMTALKNELMLVLEKLKPLLAESQETAQKLNTEQILELFEKLEPMIKKVNPECVNLIDEILSIPGAEELAYLIEDYEFEAAAETLAKLKKKYGDITTDTD